MLPGNTAKWPMDSDLYRKTFLLLGAALLGAALYQILDPFWEPLAWAVCLAFLLAPVQKRLARRFRNRHNAAAALLTGLTPLVLLGPVAALGVLFAEQVTGLLNRLQGQSLQIDSTLLARMETLPLIGSLAGWVRATFSATTEQIEGWLTSGAQAALRALASTGGNVLRGAVGTLVGFFLMLFLLFFLLRDGRSMLDRAIKLIPIDPARRTALLKLVGDSTRAVVYGSVLTAFAQGAMVGIGFAICRLPSPVVFGVLAALLSLLPVGGSALVWIPGSLFLFAQGYWGYGTFLLVFGLVVSTVDNFLRPLLVQRNAPVSTLAVFIGVIGGVSAFGAIGLIIGPVILTLIAALVRFIEERPAQGG
jgi:predicted PurR-regulated permease PerM